MKGRIMTVLATEQASATAGREGKAQSENGKIDMDLSPPGSNGPGTNPEQLFAAGYSACFGQAIKAMAKQHDIAIDANALEVSAVVTLHKGEDGGFYISAELDGRFDDGVSQEDAETLVRAAHQICPYSKATRRNVDVVLKANGAGV